MLRFSIRINSELKHSRKRSSLRRQSQMDAFTSSVMQALYCIGKKTNQSSSENRPPQLGRSVSSNPATHVQVVPTELMLKPGDKVSFRVRLFDAQGNFIREEPAATWSLDQLKGTVENGQFTAGN